MAKKGLVEVNNNKKINPKDSIYLTDPIVISALKAYEKGKELKEEGDRLINMAKDILDEKIYNVGIRKAHTDNYIINITEYFVNRFDSEALKEYDNEIYELFIKKNLQKRYNIKNISKDVDNSYR